MAGNLTRHSTGLTPAHRELVKLLAQIAIDNYLREIEAASECTDESAHEHEAMTR